MNTEELLQQMDRRIDALEREQMDRLASEIALDCLLDAIIATHPDPEELRASFRVHATNKLMQFGDLGFERGQTPDSTNQAAAGIRKHIDAYLRRLG